MANISIGAIIEKEQEEFEKKLKLRIIASEAFYQHQEKKKAERQKQALEKEISKVNNVIHALKEIKLALNVVWLWKSLIAPWICWLMVDQDIKKKLSKTQSLVAKPLSLTIQGTLSLVLLKPLPQSS